MTALSGIRVVHQGWGRFLLAELRLPDGRLQPYEVEDHGDAVALLPYDPVRRVAMLVRQTRPPLLARGAPAALLEAPAGRLDEADPWDCARREALEEAGLRLGPLELVAQGWTMPAISTERIHLFLAPFSETDQIAAGGGLAGEGEFIEACAMPLAELAAMSDRNELTDVKTLLLVLALRLRHPALFA